MRRVRELSSTCRLSAPAGLGLCWNSLRRSWTVRSSRATASARSAYRPIQNRFSAARDDIDAGRVDGADRGPRLEPEPRELLGLGGQHPGVLAEGAGLVGDARPVGRGRHPGQAAGHRRVRVVAGHRERPQHGAAGLEAGRAQRRGRGHLDVLLADPDLRAGFDPAAQVVARRAAQLRREQRRPEAPGDRLDDELGRGGRARGGVPRRRRTTRSGPTGTGAAGPAGARPGRAGTAACPGSRAPRCRAC